LATLPPFGNLESGKAATFWQRCHAVRETISSCQQLVEEPGASENDRLTIIGI
jgi:hypothetical protein